METALDSDHLCQMVLTDLAAVQIQQHFISQCTASLHAEKSRMNSMYCRSRLVYAGLHSKKKGSSGVLCGCHGAI